jgi:hypothetical protein
MPHVTAAHRQEWEDKGYFILRNLVPRDTVMELRGIAPAPQSNCKCAAHAQYGTRAGLATPPQ